MADTLVTGATGFIGSRLVRLLLDRGDDVVALVRPGSPAAVLDGLPVSRVEGDILDRRAMRHVMRRVTRLFHVAGSSDINLPAAAVFAVNVEGTRIVLEEALRAGVERVVMTSSAAAIGPAPPGELADETAAWHRSGIPYADSKHESEVTALRLHERGLPVVIVNPAAVIGAGEGGGTVASLVRRFLRREIPAYVDGTLNVVGVEDVVRGHLLADERGELGERYILGNRNYTLDRLFVDLARLSGIDPPPVKLPAAVARALAASAGQLSVLPWLPTTAEIRAISRDWAYSNQKARRELRWTPAPHEECLESAIAYWREREGAQLARIGHRQPLVLRAAGGIIRRLPFA